MSSTVQSGETAVGGTPLPPGPVSPDWQGLIGHGVTAVVALVALFHPGFTGGTVVQTVVPAVAVIGTVILGTIRTPRGRAVEAQVVRVILRSEEVAAQLGPAIAQVMTDLGPVPVAAAPHPVHTIRPPKTTKAP